MAAQDESQPVQQVHLEALFEQFEEKDPITEFPEFQNVLVARKGSGILSNVRQERIMARRARIERQLLRNDKNAHARETGAKLDENKNAGYMPSYAPVLESAKNLRRTFLKNEQTLHGYLKSACRRRVYRRQAVNDHFVALEKRISEHQKNAKNKLEMKMRKYGQMADKTLGLDELAMLLEKYKEYGKEFIESKQIFVNEIEDEVKSLDDNFVRMLRSFHKDMDVIRKKATDMTTKMTSVCRKEIYDLDKTFASLEGEYLRKLNTSWETSHTEIRNRDDAIMVQREEFMEEMLNNMKVLRTTKLDSYLEVKLTLDNDVLLMTEQLQNMRTSFLVNAEKLDYNLEVIQLREDESIKTKNKQKRIITKIQDEVARTTNELRLNEKSTKHKLGKHKSEYIVMTTELVNLHQTFDESARKEWSIFRDSWISNELALRDGLKTLLLLDRFITEEICSCKWQCPNLWFLGHIGPIHGKKWRAQVLRYQQELEMEQETGKNDSLTKRLTEEHTLFWSILNSRTKRLAAFRRLSIVRRPHSPLRENNSGVDAQFLESPPENGKNMTSPTYFLGPVMRWIVQHFDFLNEDYVIDVINQLTWQDCFCFRIQAFLDHFKQFNYEDVCQLALFFVRFSVKTNDAVAHGEPLSKEDVSNWLHGLTPQEFLHRRITFNDVLLALQAFIDFKQNERWEAAAFDLTKSLGRGRDTASDADYLKQYTEMFDIRKKMNFWQQLLYGTKKEARISERKMKLTAQGKMLNEKNGKLKHLLKSHLSCEDDELFVYPPLWNKMETVACELSNSVRKSVGLASRIVGPKKPKELQWSQSVHMTRSGMLEVQLKPGNQMVVNGITVP